MAKRSMSKRKPRPKKLSPADEFNEFLIMEYLLANPDAATVLKRVALDISLLLAAIQYRELQLLYGEDSPKVARFLKRHPDMPRVLEWAKRELARCMKNT
jgi:hypothetical protein